MYLIIVEETQARIVELLKASNPNFNQLKPTNEQMKWLVKHLEDCEYKKINTEEYWKMYKIYHSKEDVFYIEFLFFRGHSGTAPDYYFKEEISALSRLSEKDIFHIWSQHADEGYEVYRAGDCVNSVIRDTHGPAISVNGKEARVPMKSTWYGEKYEEGQVIDENSLIPKNIRDNVKYKKLPSDFIMFIDKGIPDFESLVSKIKS